MGDLDAAIPAAIATYNEYRSPMARASLVSREGGTFRVRFTGPFCTTCCRDDYFEDLVYELGPLGVPVESIEVREVERVGPETFVVTFVHST